jgi:hypothetical protein
MTERKATATAKATAGSLSFREAQGQDDGEQQTTITAMAEATTNATADSQRE